MSDPRPAIAFLGLGSMGAAIVRRLLAAEYSITGWNRSADKAAPLVQLGMKSAATPREAIAEADIAFTILTDAKALEEVMGSPEGVLAGMHAGLDLFDMSTISPHSSTAIAARVKERGGRMCDAPLSASIATLDEGNASVMVGGEREAFDRAHDVLLAIGPKVTYVGANGQALYLKLAINLSLVVQIVSFCESVAMAEKAGIAREVAVDGFLKSVVASPVMRYRGPFVLEDHMPDVAWADVDLQQKDTELALELGRKLGVAMPTGAAANQMLNAARGMGLTKKDFAVVYEVYRMLGGMA